MSEFKKQTAGIYQISKPIAKVSEQLRDLFECLPREISNGVASARGGDIAMKENAYLDMKKELYKLKFSREELHEMVLSESLRLTVHGSIRTEMYLMFVRAATEICAEREAIGNEFFQTL